MEAKKQTQISAIGRFRLIENIISSFASRGLTALKDTGENASVTSLGEDEAVLAQALLMEGIHFDLTYFPLRHLGYKAVVAAVGDVYAVNGRPQGLSLSLGVSARMGVEMVEEFCEGVAQGCEDYAVQLAGLDLTSSLTGFTISVAVQGRVAPGKALSRGGARENDLICITGDLGAAYMGLRLLEREKRVLSGHDNPQPKFEGYEYLLRRQLKPVARRGVIESLAEQGLQPSSMTLLREGLSSDLLHVCKASNTGARVYLNRLPIASETYTLCEEMHTDPVVAALNGGDDYELLFTVPVGEQERILAVGGIDIIGHVTAPGTGVMLVTPDGGEIAMTAPGWTSLV